MKKTCVIDSTIDTTSCQKVETYAQEIVEASETEDKEVNIDVAPCVAIITKDKQEVETSEKVPEYVETEVVNNVTTCKNIEREGQIEVAPAVVIPEIIKSEVMENTETEIKVIEKTVDEKVIEPNSPPTVIDSEIKKVEITEMQNAPETVKCETKDIVENAKKEETIIPDENIEDEVFSSGNEEHKNEKEEHKVLCNHVGSEMGSYSSDSSDDENVCGSYHVESPLDEKTHKMKVETIVEEQSESRMNGEVSEQVSTEETKLVNVSETNAEKISNNVSGVENGIEELTEIKKGKENNTQFKNEKDDETTEGKVIAGQSEDENNERKVDEKRDFDIVVSEQKTVSPDGNQIISVRSERRTETIQKEVFTHTRRELKPEEFAMYEKEIAAADRRNKIQTEGIKEITDTVVVESKGGKTNMEPEQIKEIKTQRESEDIQEIKTQTESEGIKEIKMESEEVKEIEKTEVENPEDDVVEVKIVKSDHTLEENVKKMKYIDESSGDSGSVKIKQNEEAPEVVTTIVNEEAGKDLESEAPKLDKKESMRLKKEEKERKKKELAEEKERLKREKQEEKERLKKEKQELKEQKKREKEAEKERKKKEKEEARSKKRKDDKNDVKPGIEETQEENKDVEQKKENVEQAEEPKPKEVEERVPTAIALVMAKQKEEEKMEEIDLNDEPAVEEVAKEEPPTEKNKKRKKSKKDKKEKEPKTPQNKKKHKTTGCFAFSAVPSSDEEEVKVQEEVKEEIVQEVHMFIYFQVQVIIGI